MNFTKKELSMIQDREFHRTKIIINNKANELLAETRAALKNVLGIEKLSIVPPNSIKNGKISRGENYLGLPYQMLDFPAVFSQSNVFAFRTMFWWGNFFSATLHLEGKYLDFYRANVLKQFSLLQNQNIFIGIGKTPWHYHYESDNYEQISEDHKAFVEECKFLKLSVKLNLERWPELPAFSSDFFKRLLMLLA